MKRKHFHKPVILQGDSGEVDLWGYHKSLSHKRRKKDNDNILDELFNWNGNGTSSKPGPKCPLYTPSYMFWLVDIVS